MLREELCWIIWVVLKCNHKCPCEREAKENLIQAKITEARFYAAGFQDRNGARATMQEMQL